MPNWSTRRAAKPKPQEDLPDFDEDFLSLLRQIMPQDVIPTGWPLYRRGGSYRHWTTAGQNNYVPTGFTQIGVYEWEAAADSHVQELVVLPRRYTGRFLVWCQILDTAPATKKSVCMAWPNQNGAEFFLDWWSLRRGFDPHPGSLAHHGTGGGNVRRVFFVLQDLGEELLSRLRAVTLARFPPV